MNSPSNRSIVTMSFLAGFAVASFFRLLDKKKKIAKNRKNAGALNEGDDASLFYDKTKKDHRDKKLIDKNKQFLPAELYGRLVRNTVVVCVDCLIVRYNAITNRHECLLVERADEPAKNLWWLPGGRLIKGETFFEGALRKVKEETGLKNDDNAIKPIQILGFYNTFFSRSSWDTEEEKGTQTVQPIVLVKLEKHVNDILLDRTSERYRWISLDPEEAKINKEDEYVLEALARFQAWSSSYGSASGI